jgi:hypothetical protein
MPNTKKTPHKTHKKWGKYDAKFQFSCTKEMKEFLQKKTASWLRNLIIKNYGQNIQKPNKSL